MRKVSKAKQKSNAKTRMEAYEALIGGGEVALNSRVLMIQQLIPIGLMAVEAMLQEEILELAGARSEREKSSVSRKFISMSSQRLKEFNERDLSQEDIIAIFMEGKTFSENEMVVALGVTMEGDKKIRGMVETHTENYLVCKQFLQRLKERGLRDENKMLFIIDGAKGLHKGIVNVFGTRAFIMRCQWHKRENVLAYLPKEPQDLFCKKLQNVYQEKTYKKAKERLAVIRKELSLIHQSAVNSLDEGLEETLTLHRLGVFDLLGGSLKTTNCIEAINSQLERYTPRITFWKNSSQRQRWVTTALLEIEPSLRRIRGYKHLHKLRLAMEQKEHEKILAQAA